MSPSEILLALEELSNMTDDPSESNPTFSVDSTLEDNTRYILYFKSVQKTKVIFLVGPLGGIFIAFQLGLLVFGFFLLALHVCFSKYIVVNLRHLSLILSILEILCINYPPNGRMIAEAQNK